MIFLKFIHILAVLVWVGGMFFAYVILRPSAVITLQPPERLCLWDAVFKRFFGWVWVAICLFEAVRQRNFASDAKSLTAPWQESI